jgi:transcription antitermination factor NusG
LYDTQVRWFAVVVKPRHEKVVARTLKTKGVESFLPLYTARHRWANRTAIVHLPLFPEYLFSRFYPSDKSRVLSTPGLFDIVRCGKELAPVSDQEISALRRVAASDLATEPWPDLVIGEDVQMQGGPLVGLVGKLLEMKKSMRLVFVCELAQSFDSSRNRARLGSSAWSQGPRRSTLSRARTRGGDAHRDKE